MSQVNRLMYKKTIWPTNKYSLALKLIICEQKNLQKPESFVPK